jgi:Flp pilus assembly pilin Flp
VDLDGYRVELIEDSKKLNDQLTNVLFLEGGETHMTFYGYLTELIAVIRRREEGQTMAEYGVILAVITVAVIAALVALSTGLFDNLMSVVDAIS